MKNNFFSVYGTEVVITLFQFKIMRPYLISSIQRDESKMKKVVYPDRDEN